MFRQEPGGAWGTPYNGLCQKAPPYRGNFFGVQVNERVENQRSLQITSCMLAYNCLICRLGAQSMIFKSNVKITRHLTCLVSWTRYSARPMHFRSRGPSKGVRPAFPARSLRIHHRSELTEKAWGNAVQGLGKAPGERHLCKQP